MYNEISSIYDNIMNEEIDYSAWCEYLESLFMKYSIHKGEVLDLGCGTGNITIPLSKVGYKMTGVDISEEMLSAADNKAYLEKLNIKWIHHDMVKFMVPKAYDAVISCCDAVNYVIDDVELGEMFSNVYKSLKEYGVFMFDIQSHYKISKVYGDNTFTYTSNNMSYIWENYYDKGANIIEYYLNFFIKNEFDDYYSRIEEIHYQKAYQIDELYEMLCGVGFKTVEVFKFNSFKEPCDKDERLQICCLKDE